MNHDKLIEELRQNGLVDIHGRAGSKVYVEKSLLREAADVIEEQVRQLKEWEKYTGFLYSHGFFRENEPPVDPDFITVTNIED